MFLVRREKLSNGALKSSAQLQKVTIHSRLIAGYKISAVASSQCFIFIYASCAVCSSEGRLKTFSLWQEKRASPITLSILFRWASIFVRLLPELHMRTNSLRVFRSLKFRDAFIFVRAAFACIQTEGWPTLEIVSRCQRISNENKREYDATTRCLSVFSRHLSLAVDHAPTVDDNLSDPGNGRALAVRRR